MESMDSPTDPASRLVPLPGPASSQSQAPVGGDKDEAEDREDRGPGTGGLVLILVCLALGAALSWGWREHGGRRQVLGVLDGLRVDSAMAQARQSQLAELLMDPQTTLIHLVGKHENASRQAVVAWNASRSAGIFVCEGLPPPQANQEYHLWLLTDAPDKQDHPAGIPAGSESGAAPSAEAARVDAGVGRGRGDDPPPFSVSSWDCSRDAAVCRDAAVAAGRWRVGGGLLGEPVMRTRTTRPRRPVLVAAFCG